MTYTHTAGDLCIRSPRFKTHHLTHNEALALLDAHRQAYRMAYANGDYDHAAYESDLHGELMTAVGDKRRWDAGGLG